MEMFNKLKNKLSNLFEHHPQTLMQSFKENMTLNNLKQIPQYFLTQYKTLSLIDLLYPFLFLLSIFTLTWGISLFTSNINGIDSLWGLGFFFQSAFYLYKSFSLDKFSLEKLTFS